MRAIMMRINQCYIIMLKQKEITTAEIGDEFRCSNSGKGIPSEKPKWATYVLLSRSYNPMKNK